MLNDRRKRVLEALIAEYVSSACPVGSRTLVEHYQLGVSPATVRNELSVLEEEGYLSSPHVSAGRVPTDIGYRSFVDDLLSRMDAQDASPDFSQDIPESCKPNPDPLPEGLRDELQASAQELDDLVRNISSTLTRFTNCLSIVMAPTVYDVSLARISLIPVENHVLVIVLVTEDGQVLNRHVDFTAPIEDSHAQAIERALNNILVGRGRQDFAMNRDIAALSLLGDPIMNELLDHIEKMLQEMEAGGSKVHHMGAAALLSQPEFSDAQQAVPIMQLLEDNMALLEILRSSLNSENGADTSIRIGHENENDNLSQVSVVASRFGSQGDNGGLVAVVGPTRMDYERTISAVRSASKVLDETVLKGK